MKYKLLILALTTLATSAQAQQTLTLDSCRAMALRNNKTLSASRLQLDMARYNKKAAKTKYLPHISALGGYELTSREISLLSKDQKSALANAGTNTTGALHNDIAGALTSLAQQGILTPEQASNLGGMFGQVGSKIGEAVNHVGQNIVDAFRTDTRQMYALSVMLTQPIYMGGAIIAANRMADIGEEMAQNNIEASTQNTLHSIDQAYWTVVSVHHKKKLAESYLAVVKKLDDDVSKMIHEGVATRADGLKVDVKVNEAEMSLTQAENGLALAKMLLCQLCGMDVDSNITLADENADNLVSQSDDTQADRAVAMENRPELKLLQNSADMSRQATKLVRAAYLPQVLLTGGYVATNPNVFNGFERKLSGMWNVGVMELDGGHIQGARKPNCHYYRRTRTRRHPRKDRPAGEPKPIQGEGGQPPSGYGNEECGERRGKPALRQPRIQGGRNTHYRRYGCTDSMGTGTIAEDRRRSRRENESS